jgi:hypothetical protein
MNAVLERHKLARQALARLTNAERVLLGYRPKGRHRPTADLLTRAERARMTKADRDARAAEDARARAGKPLYPNVMGRLAELLAGVEDRWQTNWVAKSGNY